MRLSRLLLLVNLLPGLGAQDLPSSAPPSASAALSAGAPLPIGSGALPATPALADLSVAIINVMARSDCQPHFPPQGSFNPATGVPQMKPSGIIALTFGMPQTADCLILGIGDATVRSAILDTGEDLTTIPLPDSGRRYNRGRRADWLYRDTFQGSSSPQAGDLRFGSCTIAGPRRPAASFKTLALEASLLVVSTAELHHETLALALGASVQVRDVPGVQLVITPKLASWVRVTTTVHSLPLIVAVDFFTAAHQPLHATSSVRNDRSVIDLQFPEAPASAEITCMTQAHHATVTMSFDGLALTGESAAGVIGPKPVTTMILGESADLGAEITKAYGPETAAVAIPAPEPAPSQALHNSNF